jgi:hypothetical protein
MNALRYLGLRCALCLVAACSSSDDERQSGNALEGGRPPAPKCTLEDDGSCTPSGPDVTCCPQKGRPYDVDRKCWLGPTETVYCDAPADLPACGAGPALGCAVTTDGTRGWLKYSTWEGTPPAGIVSEDNEVCSAMGVYDAASDSSWPTCE